VAPAGVDVVRALVVTISNRAAAGVYEDRTGPLLVAGLTDLGFAVDGPEVVPDGDPVEAALRAAVASSYDVVVSSGGTGISPTDRTPEMTRRVLDRELPGIAESVRAYGVAHGIPAAALSRGLAGTAGTRKKKTMIIPCAVKRRLYVSGSNRPPGESRLMRMSSAYTPPIIKKKLTEMR